MSDKLINLIAVSGRNYIKTDQCLLYYSLRLYVHFYPLFYFDWTLEELVVDRTALNCGVLSSNLVLGSYHLHLLLVSWMLCALLCYYQIASIIVQCSRSYWNFHDLHKCVYTLMWSYCALIALLWRPSEICFCCLLGFSLIMHDFLGVWPHAS